MRIELLEEYGGGIRLKPWWRNFVESTVGYLSDKDKLNEELRPYRAKYKSDLSNTFRWLEFDNEQDYFMFVLRWS